MMKGLLTKEIIVLLKNSKMQLCLVAVFVIVGVLSKSPMYIMLSPLLLPMLAKQGLAIDETSKWDKYSVCLPVDRKNIVTSKYILVAITSIAALVVTAAAIAVFNLMDKGSSGVMDGMPIYLSLAVAEALILPSFSLPFDFKFGAVKARVMYLICGAVIAGLTGALLAKSDSSDILAKLSSKPSTLLLISIAVSVAAFIASLLISSKIYEAKEI